MLLEALGDARWLGRRCIVAATGPSLDPAVAERCRGELVIAVNDAYRLFPDAQAMYACDAAWWELHKACPDFAGEKWTSHSTRPMNDKTGVADRFGLRIVRGERRPGFSFDPNCIHYGHNSGFQAVNMALLWGANPIVLVGFDMREIAGKRHFFGDHKAPLKNRGPFPTWISAFRHAKLPPGIRILNATPGSALGCYPMVTLDEALA